MTRRVSKRTLLHRLDGISQVRIHLDSLRSSSAHALVDGLACEVRFPRKLRSQLLREGGVFGTLEIISEAIGDGGVPSGRKSVEFVPGLPDKTNQRPRIDVLESFTEAAGRAFMQFQKHYPVGSIIIGKVRRVNRRAAILDLDSGLQGRLDKGQCLDYTPGSPVRWLPLPSAGDCVDVMVRGFNKTNGRVVLSRHSFHQNARFCGFTAGYRSSASAVGAGFERFPWDK